MRSFARGSSFVCWMLVGLMRRVRQDMTAEDSAVISGQALWQWRQEAWTAATHAGIPTSEVDWLLQELAGLDRLTLRLGSFQAWPTVQLRLPLSQLNQRWQQRLIDRVPVQYLAGIAPWRQFSLKVSPAVLIPRPETELMIDLAVTAAQQRKSHSPSHSATPEQTSELWADLGTGSGAIAIGLADGLPQATVYAVDQSAAALAIAQQNAQDCGVSDRIQFRHGSWFTPLAELRGQLSGMVSNPPYIPSDLVLTLQPEVTNHEPHLALDGGADGLDCIRHLVQTAPDYLKPGGIWLIEMMAGQAPAIAELLTQQGAYEDIQIHADLAGIERFALAYRR
jgi:release factor glutamine methyltransferase